MYSLNEEEPLSIEAAQDCIQRGECSLRRPGRKSTVGERDVRDSKGILDDSGAELRSKEPKPVRCVANEEIEP